MLVNTAHGGLSSDMFLSLFNLTAVKLALNLNAVNYSTCSALRKLVYRQKIKDIDQMKQVLNSCDDMISQELINDATEQRSK